MPKDSYTSIALHCARTLPDSLSERKELLVALGNVLSADHPAFAVIEAHLALLRSVEQLQRELPLKFATPIENRKSKVENPL